MKRLVVVLLILVVALLLWWCRPGGEEATFNGTIRDPSGQPVAGAMVTLGDQETTTDQEGRFRIRGLPVEEERWVLEVRHPEYAPISKVFSGGSESTDLTTVKATVQIFDASTAIVARDNRSTCIGTPAAGDDWAANPTARFPQVVDAAGNQVTGALPASARQILDFLTWTPPCSTGFQVSIPANSLVGSSGQPVQGQVQVALTTVDLLSPDGMPGDYTVASDSGTTDRAPRYMESLGAGTVEVRAGDEVLQLAAGAKAEIVIPVDEAQVKAGSKIPPIIPFLIYQPKNGEWRQIGEARLDEELMAYVGEVGHFSEFNADVVKTNPACLRFDASGITGTFDLVITAPTSSGGYRTVTKTVQPNPSQLDPNLHAIYNLPPNEWVVLRAIKSGTPVGTWVFQTPGAWGGTSAPSYPYTACGAAGTNPFSLSETLGTGVTRANPAGDRFGPLPKHVAFLVNTSGAVEDVYPYGLGAGGGSCESIADCWYVFSLFDTGSNLVVIDTTMTAGLNLLSSPNSRWDVDVRLNGLGNVAASLVAPYLAPGGIGGAEAEAAGLRVAPRSTVIAEEEQITDASGTPTTGVFAVSYILSGAPVTNKVVAKIDHTNMITKGPWNFGTYFTITAPDIEFFPPGSTSIPSPTLTLFTEGYGTVANNPTGTMDQRHFLQNVTFTEGSATAIDNQSLTSPVRFLYDTATTFTAINMALATQLGISTTGMVAANGCSSGTPTNFVQIDSIVVVGMNTSNQLATYTVSNQDVCVDVGGTVITANYPDPANPSGPPRIVDAVIGSSLFDESAVLWNGPKRTVGILP